MAKDRRRRTKGKGRPKPPKDTIARRPRVAVKVACADMDLGAVAALVKPAVLYADSVTVYSPAALMVRSIADFGAITDRVERVSAVLQLIEQVPHLKAQVNLDADTAARMRSFLTVPAPLARAVARVHGGTEQLDALYEQLDGLSHFWDSDFPEALEQVKDGMGARELFVALEAGVVTVADLPNSSDASLEGALNAATGGPSFGDELIGGFLASIIDMVEDKRTFPLLDSSAAGLLRSMIREAKVAVPGEMHRGAAVTSATSFVNFLPYFADLPMDEVIALRKELAVPLVAFRAAVSKLSRDFASLPYDTEFVEEVERVWWDDVEPALVQLREVLADHGLLRSVEAVALGDVRRLAVDAGGAVAFGVSDLVSVSNWLTASLAVGIPAADVLGKVLLERRNGRSKARCNSMYFLHQVDEASRQMR